MSENDSGVTPLSIIKSALSAMIGVQSNENRERDFKSGKFWHFFIAGFIVLAGFMLFVWLGVKLLLGSV
jgi:hypothetical protein